MTQLVERVTITLKHCEVDSSLYCGKLDLKQVLSLIWPHLYPLVLAMDGKLEMRGIEIEWHSSGLMEEVEHNDN